MEKRYKSFAQAAYVKCITFNNKQIVSLANAGECCGFGGTFSVKNPDTSLAMLTDKIGCVRASGAEVLTAVDNSCLMHIAGGMRRQGMIPAGPGAGKEDGGIKVMHLAEILVQREEGPR